MSHPTPSEAEESTLVQVRLRPRTIAMVEKLEKLLPVGSRADVLRTSIAIAYEVVTTLSEGRRVLIEDRDKKLQKLLIPGL